MTCCSNNCSSEAEHEVILADFRRQRDVVWSVEGEELAEQVEQWANQEHE